VGWVPRRSSEPKARIETTGHPLWLGGLGGWALETPRPPWRLVVSTDAATVWPLLNRPIRGPARLWLGFGCWVVSTGSTTAIGRSVIEHVEITQRTALARSCALLRSRRMTEGLAGLWLGWFVGWFRQAQPPIEVVALGSSPQPPPTLIGD